MPKGLPSKEIQDLLKEVVEHFDKEDRTIRERQVKTWRQLKLAWEGIQRTWYSEVAHDWRIWDESSDDDTDQEAYDKPINILRAYLESIIAALSVIVPPVKCFPDDADNPLDLSTAKAGDKIAGLIYRHNDVSLLWIHALFIFMTEGMTACHTYTKSDEKFGTYKEKDYDSVEEEHETATCPNCGYAMDDREVGPDEPPLPPTMPTNMPPMLNQPPINPMEPPMDPLGGLPPEGMDPSLMPPSDMMGSPDMMGSDIPPEGMELCEACGQQVVPIIERAIQAVDRLVGETEHPKSRVCMEAYGGLYVKVANYAKKQEDTPYLIWSYETHYVNIIEIFEHLHGKFRKEKIDEIKEEAGGRDTYEQSGRLSPQYQGEYPDNNITVRNCWLRPKAFNVLDLDEAKKLKKLYPNGVRVILANDEFADAVNQALDDHWTLTYNPLSDFIHHDPLGLLLVSVQEIVNDMISLVLQTIEHGIGQTFADPAVINFEAYRKAEVVPGGIYEATAKSGKGLGDGIYEMRTATLSSEVLPFLQQIQSLGQLVSGALPSLFGGAMEGTETASQYSMSRAQALQRLQNVWKMLTIWWKTIFGKAIPMYIAEVKDDERDVQRNKDGGFVNVLIRRAELEGKIGKVELEANENLPLTWSQQKDVIMQLLQGNNEQIMAFLGAPENMGLIHQAIGLTDFVIPGEDDVVAEQDEIKQLLNSEPIPIPVDPMMALQAQMMGQPPPPTEQASVDIDIDFDNHAIRFEVVRKWVISEEGRQAKIDNEPGYRNVLLHGKAHKMALMPPPIMAGPSDGTPEEKPTEMQRNEVPIQGEGDVGTIQ